MSIATEITRIKQAKENIKTSITNKGVTVPNTATLDEYSSLIDSIESGGSSTSSTSLKYGGGNPVLISSAERVFNLAKDTKYNSIVVSSSSQEILSSFNLISGVTLDLLNYDYVIVSKILIDMKYASDIPSEYHYIKRRMYVYLFNVGKMYYTSNTNKVNGIQSIFNSNGGMIYNNGTSGEKYTSSYVSNGIRVYSNAMPYASQSGDTPNLTVYGNSIHISSNDSYMQSEVFNYIDTENSNITYKAEVYQVDKGTAPYGTAINELIDALNSGSINP